MTRRSKSMRLSPDEDDSLRRQYVEYDIPTDRFPERPADLDRFVRQWNSVTGRADSADDLMSYMVTRRKAGKKRGGNWPKVGPRHSGKPSAPHEPMSDEHEAELRAVYEQVCVSRGIGSDNIGRDSELAAEVSREFAIRTGLIRSGRALYAQLMRWRKSGSLMTIDSNKRDRGFGFGDIDEVAY